MCVCVCVRACECACVCAFIRYQVGGCKRGRRAGDVGGQVLSVTPVTVWLVQSKVTVL